MYSQSIEKQGTIANSIAKSFIYSLKNKECNLREFKVEVKSFLKGYDLLAETNYNQVLQKVKTTEEALNTLKSLIKETSKY